MRLQGPKNTGLVANTRLSEVMSLLQLWMHGIASSVVSTFMSPWCLTAESFFGDLGDYRSCDVGRWVDGWAQDPSAHLLECAQKQHLQVV